MIPKSKRFSYAVAAILGVVGLNVLNTMIVVWKMAAVQRDKTFFDIVKEYFTLLEETPERWQQLSTWFVSVGLLL